MKVLNYLMAFVMIASMGIFASCTDDAVAPTVEVALKGKPSFEKSTAVTYTVTAATTDEEDFASSVAVTDASGKISANANFASGSSSVDVTVNIPADATAGMAFTLTFTVMTDKEGEGSATASFTVVANLVASNGTIYHMLGAKAGAWDLVKNVEKKSADAEADKDMKNTTTAATTPDNGFFDAKWEAGNATRYVKVTGFDYATASYESAKAAYAAGTAVAKLAAEVMTGDIFVAKLRGEEKYAVIKIEAVNRTPNNANGTFENLDNIVFSYKKSANAVKNSQYIFY